MQLEYDEKNFPDLGRFRKACLADRLDEMETIAAKKHPWYPDENPDDLAMMQLAKVFQAHHYASENMTAELSRLAQEDPWVVNHAWTSQRWLPISQAAWAGHKHAVETLIDLGADLSLRVGAPGEELSPAEVASQAGHEGLVDLLKPAS